MGFLNNAFRTSRGKVAAATLASLMTVFSAGARAQNPGNIPLAIRPSAAPVADAVPAADADMRMQAMDSAAAFSQNSQKVGILLRVGKLEADKADLIGNTIVQMLARRHVEAKVFAAPGVANYSVVEAFVDGDSFISPITHTSGYPLGAVAGHLDEIAARAKTVVVKASNETAQPVGRIGGLILDVR